MVSEKWLRAVLTSRSALDVERLTSTDHLMAHGLTSMEMLKLIDHFNDQGFDLGYADLYRQCSIRDWLALLSARLAAHGASEPSRE